MAAEDGRKLLKDLEIELANVGFTSRLAALNATLLDDRYAKLSETVKKQARELAAQIDELKESNQEQKDAAQIVERYNNALRQMSDELFPRSEMDRLNEQLADPKVNAALSDRVKLLLRMLALTKDMRAVDPLAGAGAPGPLGPAGVEELAKQRSAESDIGWFVPTPDEDDLYKEARETLSLQKRREELRAFLSDLSQDITYAIGGSLNDLFQGKVTDFLKGFGQGLLDIGKRFLLQMVESGIFELLKMLTGLGGGGGGGAKKGGGLFGKIFGFASMALSFIPGGNIASGLLGGLLGGGGGVGAGQSAAGKVTGNFGGGFADGGVIDGPTDRTDALTARVTRGEGVLNLRAMARYGGRRLVDSLNSLSLPPDFAFAGGPLVAGQITPSVGGAELRELARSRGQGGAWGGMTGGIMERLAAALENFEAMPPDHVVMKSMSSTGVQRAVGDAFMSQGARDPRVIEWMNRRVSNQ